MFAKTEQEIMLHWKGDATQPLASICSITYNHELYVAEALDSFLMQETDFPFEIIIRDDASTDNTANIIREYEQRYPNIIKPIYEEENGYKKGIRATPVTMRKAKGKYIAVCEGDDFWTDPLKIQKQVEFLEGNDGYAITYSHSFGIDEDGIVKKKLNWAKRDLKSIEIQKRLESIDTRTACFRNVVQELPPEFQFGKFGDQNLWLLLAEHGAGKFLKDIKPSRYRFHDGGVWSKKSKKEKTLMDYLSTVSHYAYYERVGNEELSDFYQKKITYISFKINGRFFYIKAALKSIIKQIITLNKSR